MTQFLVSRGYPLEDLIKAHKENASSKRKRRVQDSAIDLVTEDLVAMQFANAHSGAFRFCHDAGSWHEWNGSYWIKDRLGRVSDIVRGLARDLARGEEQRSAMPQAKPVSCRGRPTRAHRWPPCSRV